MKIFRGVFTLLLCIIITACSNQTTIPAGSNGISSNSNLNAQNKYAIFSAISFQESESYFCGSTISGDHLYYYDKETGISGLLCADPSCTHNSSACGAYAKNGATMFLHDGKRYWITDDVQSDGYDYILWQGDISGANQKKVKAISFENTIIPYQPQQYAIHQGNFYFIGNADAISGVQTCERITLMVSPLDETKEFTALFDKTYNSYINSEVRYIGNHAFLLVQASKENSFVDLELYRINLTNGDTEVLYEGQDRNYCQGFWVTEPEKVYLLENEKLCKIENGTAIPIASLQHMDNLGKLMDGIAVSAYVENEFRYIEIMDFEGNLLYDGKLLPHQIPEIEGDPSNFHQYGLLLVGGDSDKLIIGLIGMEDSSNEFYTVCLDINNNMKPTLLWKQE